MNKVIALPLAALLCVAALSGAPAPAMLSIPAMAELSSAMANHTKITKQVSLPTRMQMASSSKSVKVMLRK